MLITALGGGIAIGFSFAARVHENSIQESGAEKVKPAITGAEADRNDSTPDYDHSLPPIEIEKTCNVASLPSSYPETCIFVDEIAFFNMAVGKTVILDVAEEIPSKSL